MGPFISPRVLWALAQWQVIFVLAAFLLQLFLILSLLITRARKRHAEIECERLARLAETENKRLNDVIANVPGIVWETRIDSISHQHAITFVSQQAEKMLGYTMDEWLSTPDFCLQLVHEADRERVGRELEQILSQKGPGILHFRWITKDNRTVWVKAQLAAIRDDAGMILGSQGVTVDVTEQELAENARRQTVENNRTILEALSRNEAQLGAENIYLQQELQFDKKFGEILGQSDAIKYVFFKINQVAPTDSTVLITGETGTGKELAARAIHGASSRKDRPLIKVNCGALSSTLIESELFGHEKGAFTGAVGRKQGRFELANGGTIFLDEIGELPLELQVKLLRVIQENEFERLGGSKTVKVNVRLIAATNRNLKLEVEQGTFREDLWYRLNVYPITMPPLRQRKEDIPLLVEHFVNTYARKFGKTISSVSPRTMQNLQAHSWPGNVRELANVIERAVIHTQGSVLQVVDSFESVAVEPAPRQTLEEVERDYIIRTLENTGWRIEGKHGAARILGLNPSTLRTRMLKLGIQRRNASFAASNSQGTT